MQKKRKGYLTQFFKQFFILDNHIFATSVTFDRIFDPTEREEWQDLEEMAVMVATGQRNLPAGYRPNLQLLHGKTDNSVSPLVVVGGETHYYHR